MQLKLPPQTIKQVKNSLLTMIARVTGDELVAPTYVERRNAVLANCAAGVYVGNMVAGVTDQASVRLVRWEAD